MALNFDTLPLKELRKGRALAWDPHAIDFSQDAADWKNLNDAERHFLLLQVVGFLVGERAVAHDLAPLQQVLRCEKGRMDEEMYITQQLFEESTHVEFFQRWIFETLPGKLGEDIPFPSGPGAPILFVELPAAMNALKTDGSPEAQLRAVCCYHQTVEGVSAEVGYQIFYDCLDQDGIMPGLRQGVRNIQVDESRHIAFGTYLARRILSENPHLGDLFEDEMARLKESNIKGLEMLFHAFGETLPFGLTTADYIKMTHDLTQRRIKSVLDHAVA